jgi:DNA-binding transcriptional ArsR family regulator
LHLEPDRLLREESPPATALRPVLDLIGQGAHRLSEIAARMGQPATSLARPLSRLVEMELVLRDTPFGEAEKSSRRSLYRLADPFLRLWFRIVSPNRALLTQGTLAGRQALWNKFRRSLVAAAWEEMCRDSVPRLYERVPKLAVQPWDVARRAWGGGGPEWDIAAHSLDGKHMLLGEVKWSDKPMGFDEIDRITRALIAKGTPQTARTTGLNVHHAVVVNEIAGKSRRNSALSVQVIEARDVLSCLR